MKNNTDSLIENNYKIRWNPSFHSERIENEGVFLFSEKKNIFLEGEIYLQLDPFLKKGVYSADELVSLLEKKASPEVIFYALCRLEKKHCIQPSLKDIPSNIAAFCGSFDIPLHVAASRLKISRVFVNFLGKQQDKEFLGALKSLNLQIVSSLEEASFSIVIVNDYLQEELLAFNREARKKKHPWMVVKPYGSTIWAGPIFESKKTGCWECLATRLKKNRAEESYIEKQKGIERFSPPLLATLQCTKHLGYNFIALEIFKWIFLGKNEKLEGKVLTLDTLSFKMEEHVLVRQPQCPCASSNQSFDKKPLILKSRKKPGNNAGGFRSISPEETLKKFSHLISPITGVVQHIIPISSSYGSSIHVYQGGANHALNKKAFHHKVENFRMLSGGKGITEMDAKVGCLCEAIERYSCIFQGYEPSIKKSYAELKEEAIDPREVLLYSEEQHKNREKTNPISSNFNSVATPFSEEAQYDWTPLWSLTNQCYKYYPTQCCYFHYYGEKTRWNALANSNGCAAGNSLEEAILQGFLELVERDGVAIWWYNRLQRPRLDLTSFKHPYIAKHLHEYEQLGRECWALDLTTDLNIPTVAAFSRLKTGEEEKIFMGFGAHLDMESALLRALTEMNQFLMSAPFWENDNVKSSNEKKEICEWMNDVTVENQPYLKGEGKRMASDFPTWNSTDLLDDIHHCQTTIEKLGMEFLVLNYTRPDIELPVVLVIVPGLRHFWRRLAPGRLYDVPLKMGWLKEATKEADMNPLPMFL